MRYVALDLETTGLDPRRCAVLQIAMILEDTTDPIDTSLTQAQALKTGRAKVVYVRPPPPLTDAWTTYAYDMHYRSGLLKACKARGAPTAAKAWDRVGRWLAARLGPGQLKHIAAGKNVAGFDLQFFPHEVKQFFSHRVLDPGSLYVDWENGIGPPSLAEIKHMLDLGDDVAHDAFEDAMDVVRVLQPFYT